jgi:hypothetical protein
MKDGSISKDEIMREAGDMMSKMKEMGGMDNMKEMFQTMAKGMGLGKNAKFDKNKMNQMMKREDNKNKMKERANQRKEQMQKEKTDEFNKTMQRRREQIALQQKYSLSSTDNPNHMVFKLDGEEDQDKSFIHPDLEKMMDDEDAAKAAATTETKKKKKKKKKKA